MARHIRTIVAFAPCVFSPVALALLTSHAAAQIEYTGFQERYVRASGGSPALINTQTAANFLAANLSLDQQFANPSPAAPSRGYATQISSYESHRIRFSGTAGGTDNYAVTDQGQGFGVSSLTVNFRLDAPKQFIFSGTTSVITQSPVAWMNIRLGYNDSTLISRTSDAGAFGPFSYTGILQPGFYQFSAIFFAGFAGTGTGSGSGTWDLTLQVPSPGTVAILAPASLTCLRRRRPCAS